MFRFILFAAGAGLLLLKSALAGPALIVDRSRVNVRADATVQSERIAVLLQGDEVERLGQKDEWAEVRLPDGRRGWVNSTLVQERLIVTGQGVRVRAAGTASAPALTAVSRGDELGKLRRQGNWYEVVLSDGRTGWISRTYVVPKDISISPAEVAPPPDPPPQEAVAPPVPPAGETLAEPEEQKVTVLRPNPYAEGLRHEASGNYGLALENFERVLQKEPDNLNAHLHAALAHKQLGDYDEAVKNLYAALEISGGRRDLHMHLGEVYRLKGEPDSTRKYKALYRGEELAPEEAVEKEQQAPEPTPVGPSIGWWGIYAGLAVGAVAVVGLLVSLLRRQRAGEKETERPREKGGKFGRELQESGSRRQQGGLRTGEENELDRQIEEKWQELQQSSEVFGPVEKFEQGLENAQLDQVLTHLETLRKGLEMQDERASIYADIVRLQNMKIETMSEEIRLLRRRK